MEKSGFSGSVEVTSDRDTQRNVKRAASKTNANENKAKLINI